MHWYIVQTVTNIYLCDTCIESKSASAVFLFSSCFEKPKLMKRVSYVNSDIKNSSSYVTKISEYKNIV